MLLPTKEQSITFFYITGPDHKNVYFYAHALMLESGSVYFHTMLNNRNFAEAESKSIDGKYHELKIKLPIPCNDRDTLSPEYDLIIFEFFIRLLYVGSLVISDIPYLWNEYVNATVTSKSMMNETKTLSKEKIDASLDPLTQAAQGPAQPGALSVALVQKMKFRLFG